MSTAQQQPWPREVEVGEETGQERVSSREAGREVSGRTVEILLMKDRQEPPCEDLAVNARALLVV